MQTGHLVAGIQLGEGAPQRQRWGELEKRRGGRVPGDDLLVSQQECGHGEGIDQERREICPGARTIRNRLRRRRHLQPPILGGATSLISKLEVTASRSVSPSL